MPHARNGDLKLIPRLVLRGGTSHDTTYRRWVAAVCRRRGPRWVDEYVCDHPSHWVRVEALACRTAHAYLDSQVEGMGD